MADSYFQRLDPGAGAGRYLAGSHTAGPWTAQFQHGGPPTALAVAVAEHTLLEETGRRDFVALRVATDFVGPVPVGELDVAAGVRRAARSAALVEVTISANGRDCLLVRVWFVHDTDTAAVAAPLSAAATEIPEGPSGSLGFSFGYGDSLDWRFVRGRMEQPGPAAAWVRARLPLFDGYDYSGLARVALAADSGSGISAELDWSRWSFLNVDLDIHLARPFEGEWLLLDAVTQLGAHGSALARSTLSDRHGIVGAGLQTLVLAPARAD